MFIKQKVPVCAFGMGEKCVTNADNNSKIVSVERFYNFLTSFSSSYLEIFLLL